VDVQVDIEGVSDPRVANRIERRIREVCKHDERSGQWQVVLSPSETRGQWDLGVRGPSVRYFASSTTERVDRLADWIVEQLRSMPMECPVERS
jgi:hypothetical protein